MKNFILLLILIYGISSVKALEIQCKTPSFEDALIVVKTSENSNITYLLLFNETDLEKYWPLDDSMWSDNEHMFHYRDEETEILINKTTLTGSFNSQGVQIRGEGLVELTDCNLY